MLYTQGHPIPHIQKEVERDCAEREKKGAVNIPIHQQNASMPDSREWIKQGMDPAEWGKQCVQKAMRRQLQEAKEKTREKIADYQKNKDTRDKAGFEVLDNLDGKGDGRIEVDQVSRALTPGTEPQHSVCQAAVPTDCGAWIVWLRMACLCRNSRMV